MSSHIYTYRAISLYYRYSQPVAKAVIDEGSTPINGYV
jgi:hypothetical protein